MADEIKNGDTVEVSYKGTFDDGTVFDSTDGGEPFQFEVGSDNVIKGLSAAVLGMKVGEKKTVKVSQEDAFGEYQEELVMDVPKDNLPEELSEGDVLSDSQMGLQWVVREIHDKGAKLDANHPLAGKTLNFDVEVLSVSQGAQEQKES